jgi:ubiquitin C-terminal hydrolase
MTVPGAEASNSSPSGKLGGRPPPNREVARPVANLGNTCYMNAVLQALAHAPELCMAMDVEPHYASCPIYLENAHKRRSSPSSSPDPSADSQNKTPATRKSRRSSGKKSPTQGGGGLDADCKFCALCEVELHLGRVHSATNNRDKPVAPSAFVSGFIEEIAPWFKLGVQEDSHEFLRLLIDAMQRSCKQARTSQENPQDTPPERSEDDDEDDDKPDDLEYPFQLFRGTVESNVTCESCKSTSSTLDPIEDIGLDVSPSSHTSTHSPPAKLADVGSAFQRFARAEALDSGYKCENCGKVGRATKQSRLASIPPILTLHLKRFRYGETAKPPAGNAGPSSRRSGRSSEVSKLLGSTSTDFYGGKSGSAKIEGHSKFEQIFDLKPYLTRELQSKHSNMFCRLFAVIVHAGKNSHSGHYIAYVRNVGKNEWWKMDDARVTLASVQEVMHAEAYMLFYRVVEHPFAVQLRNQAKKLQDEYKETEQKMDIETKLSEVTSIIDVEESAAPIAAGISSSTPAPDKPEPMSMHPATPTSTVSPTTAVARSSPRKRKTPEYSCGEEWARAKTTLPEQVIAKFADIEQIVSEYVHFKPDFFKLITEQASKGNAKVGQGPNTGVCGRSWPSLDVSMVHKFLGNSVSHFLFAISTSIRGRHRRRL